MKKIIIKALAAAFVIGTGATTFAATSPFSNAPLANSPFRDVPSTNPFSDVPRTHWAYKSIQYLKDLGILEGYANPVTGEANNEFKRRDRYGNVIPEEQQYITRYEMAQMVAKALARFEEVYAEGAISNVSNNSGDSLNRGDLDGYRDLSSREVAAVRGELQKLRAEFSNELDRLGVRVNELDGRVSELEKYADKVVWRGKIEYTYHSYRTQTQNANGSRTKHRDNDDTFVFRLEPTATVNDHWFLWARIDAKDNMKYDTHSQKDFYLVRGWAQGNYDNFRIRFGKPDLYTNEDGLIWDTDFSGADIQFGKKLQTRIFAGRFNADTTGGGTRGYYYQNGNRAPGEDPGNFLGVNLQYVPETNKGLYGGAAYYRIKDDDFKTAGKLYSDKAGGENVASVWSVNAGYWFGDKFRVYGAYANNTKADIEDYSWQAQARYGNYADRAKRNDWAIFAGYKRQGTNTSFSAINWDDVILGTKGWNVGTAWAPMDNVGVILKYFNGKYITGRGDAEKLFARVELFY